jgi:hypothetical protein
MKKALLLALIAASASAQPTTVPVAQVAEDARVIDRVAQASKKDLPRDLLKRIVTEDIDLLRGKRPDQTYLYASYDRQDAGRESTSASVEPAADNEKITRVEIRGSFVYRLIIELPTRRMLVTHNKKLWIDRADLEYIPVGSSASKLQSVRVETWLEPGASKTIEFPEIARQATARVYARADKDSGYGNIVLTLVSAKIFDNVDSPYADAVASAKSILRALDNSDIPSIRSMATRMHDDLAGKSGAQAVTASIAPIPAPAPASTVDVTAPRNDAAMPADMYAQLQSIEDLMTGSDAEKREGLDKLHQLVRRLRPAR